jgi:hypothetical protein
MPVTEQGASTIRINQELRELYKTPDLVTEIEKRNLEWLGHGMRLDQTSVNRTIFKVRQKVEEKTRESPD